VYLGGHAGLAQSEIERHGVFGRNALVLVGLEEERRRRLLGDLLLVGETLDQLHRGVFADQVVLRAAVRVRLVESDYRIAENHEIVLIDSCSLQKGGVSLTDHLYECNTNLDIDNSLLNSNIEYLSEYLHTMANNPNMFSPTRVLEESRVYLKILNGSIKYHSKNFNLRRGSSKSRRKDHYTNGLRGKTYTNDEVMPEEAASLDLLKLHADQVFSLLNLLKNRKSELEDKGLLEEIKNIASKENLKRNYNARHNWFTKEANEDKFTDEYIIANAYELASKDKNVAIISDDSDLKRILNRCFLENDPIFEVPRLGRMALYSKFREEEYMLKFDTTFLLHDLD